MMSDLDVRTVAGVRLTTVHAIRFMRTWHTMRCPLVSWDVLAMAVTTRLVVDIPFMASTTPPTSGGSFTDLDDVAPFLAAPTPR